MNLKRHHVLYAVLVVCLIAGLVVLLTPGVPRVSYTPPVTASSTGSSQTGPLGKASTTTVLSSPPASKVLPMKFEVVTTPAAQEQGLGGRADVPENYAMLFVFPSDQNIGFWMKDMLVPIDMIWLSDDGTILGIDDSVTPDTYPQVFYPPQPVKYVLETRAGEARRRGWSVDTKVSLPAPYGLPSAR